MQQMAGILRLKKVVAIARYGWDERVEAIYLLDCFALSHKQTLLLAMTWSFL